MLHFNPRSIARHLHLDDVPNLGRYRPEDFIALVDRHGIAWHEKTLGQLFCDGSARQIVAMLLDECDRGGVTLRLGASISSVDHASSTAEAFARGTALMNGVSTGEIR